MNDKNMNPQLIRQSFAPAPSPTPSLSNEHDSRDSPRRTSSLKLVLFSLPSLQPSDLPNSTRTQVCKSASIPYRDLRILDSPLVDDEPAILVREHCIVYAGEGVRAIVRCDRLIIVRGEDDVGIGHNPSTIEVIHSTLQSLEHRLNVNEFSKRTYPFEFNALESLLMHSFSLLEKRVASLTLSTDTLIETLRTKGIEHDQLLDMLDLSQAVDRANRKVRGMHKAIEEVLREEEDMAAMYLTAKHFGTPRNEGEDDEVELLLEAYLKQSSTLCTAVSTLTTRLQSTSKHVDLVMAATRNRLLHLEIQLAVVTAALGLGSFFTGLLGMNLMNHFEEHPTAFYIFTSFLFVVVTITIKYGISVLNATRWSRIQAPSKNEHQESNVLNDLIKKSIKNKSIRLEDDDVSSGNSNGHSNHNEV